MTTSITPDNKMNMFTRWQVAVQLFWRHFPLVYPIFAFFVLLDFVIPKTAEAFQPEYTGKWMLLIAAIYCIWLLFESGWTYMAYEATKKYLNKTPVASGDEEPGFSSISESFSVLKNFFPGVGHYGVSFLVAGFLEFLPKILILGLGYYVLGAPQKLGALVATYQHVLSQPSLSITEQQQALNQQLPKVLTEHDVNQLSLWFLLLLLTFAVSIIIKMSLLYWRCQICRNDENPVKALWSNLLLVAKHPFATIGINLFFELQFILLTLLALGGDLFKVIITPILMILIVVKSLYLFLYMDEVSPQQSTEKAIGTQVDISV